MAKQCLFCDNQANSKEHLWSDWILQRLGTQPTRIKMGKAPATTMDHSVVEVRCVCSIPCNGGGVSGREAEKRPVGIRPVGKTTGPLYAPQQQHPAALSAIEAKVVALVADDERVTVFS